MRYSRECHTECRCASRLPGTLRSQSPSVSSGPPSPPADFPAAQNNNTPSQYLFFWHVPCAHSPTPGGGCKIGVRISEMPWGQPVCECALYNVSMCLTRLHCDKCPHGHFVFLQPPPPHCTLDIGDSLCQPRAVRLDTRMMPLEPWVTV